VGIVTVLRDEHKAKTLLPMDVNEVGRVTDIRPVQKENAKSPIVVSDEGMVTV
jgi:hypothetical protein